MATLTSKFKLHIDIRTQYLVDGYVRIIKIDEKIIPTSIVQLIINFFYAKSKVVCIKQHDEYKTNPPIITVADLQKNQNVKCDIKSLNESLSDHIFQINDAYAMCYVQDFDLPNHLIKSNDSLYEKRSYDVIFKIPRSSTIKPVAFIIESTPNHDEDKINAYYWQLPSTKQYTSYSHVIYSSKYGLIVSGGSADFGYHGKKNGIITLSFKDDEMKWNDSGCKWRTEERDCHCSALISQDKLICCGGDGTENDVDIFDFTTKELIQLTDLNRERRFSGICADKFNQNKRVYVGGGTRYSNEVEYIDLIKNKSISLAKTNGDHSGWPMIWNDNENIINIASIRASKTFEKIDIRENRWNEYITNKAFDNLFGEDVIKAGMNCRLLISTQL